MDQTQTFLKVLTGNAETPMVWQVFCDYDKKRKDLARVYEGAYSGVNQMLTASNDAGLGVYACVNGGGRKQADITKFRACFIDSDGDPYPSHWPVPPHMIVGRDATHWHAYWLLDGEVDPKQWSTMQYSLATFFGTDPTINNADRVMRIPGFKHCKDLQDKKEYEVIYTSDHNKYTIGDLLVGHVLSHAQESIVSAWLDKREAKLQTSGDFVETDTNIRRFTTYLRDRAEVAIEGSGGDQRTFAVCAAGRDHGLSPETTLGLILEHWNDRCDPPWDEDELRHKIINAYQYASNGLGSSTPEAMFSEPAPLPAGVLTEPPVPQQPAKAPMPNIQPAAEVVEGERQAAGSYGKNHTTNADTYLGTLTGNQRIVCSDQETYVYNGKCYDRLQKDILEASIQQSMDYTQPKVADITGTAQIVRFKTMAKDAVLPCWLSDKEASTGNVIAFNNGLFDVGTNTLHPHSNEFFSTGVLDYDYTPESACPHWEAFLESIWEGDAALKLQLQQYIGYLLVADYRHQRIGVLIGKGRSGKGTIARVLNALLGAYNTCSPSLSGLAKDDILDSMSGKNVAIISDAHSVSQQDRSKVLENLKRISGNDAITYSRKYKGAQTETFPARILMICNEMPSLIDNSNALAMRLLVFPFLKSFHGREDTALIERLLGELPGICNWAIEGLRNLYAAKVFSVAPSSNRRYQELMRELSPILHFVDERVIIDGNKTSSVKDLYAAYNTWTQEFGMSTMRRPQFQKALQANIEGELFREPVTHEWCIHGIDIRTVVINLPAGVKAVV